MRNLVLGDYTGRVYVVNPAADAVAGMPAYATVGDIPDDVDVAIVAVPAEAVQDVVLDCAAKGVHGLVVISVGLRRDRRGGPPAAAPAGRAGPLLRPAADRPQLPRHHQHRPATSRSTPRSSPLMPPRGRAGFFCQSGALGLGDPREGRATAASASRRSSAPATAPTCPATTSCSTGRRTTPPRSCCSTSSRSATRASSRRIARRVSRRKPIIAVRSGRTTQGVPMGHAVRPIARAAGRRRRDVPAGRRDPGRHPRRDVRRRPAARPPAAAARAAGSPIVGNSDALGLLAADAAVGGRPAWSTSSVALGADATAEDFEDALDAAIDDPEVDSVVAVYIPPLNVSGEEVANVLAAVGEQSDKPLVSTFLGAEGVPELLRVPDVAGSHRRPRLGAVVPRGRGGRARARPRRRVRRVAAHARRRRWSRRRASTTARAKRLVTEPAATSARRPRPRPSTSCTTLLAAYGIDLWERDRGHHPRRGGRGRRASSGWDVVLKATADHLRAAARPGPRVAQHRHRRARCATPGSRCSELDRPTPTTAGFVVQRNAPPGRAGRDRAASRTRCSGRSCRSAISGPLTELLGDRAYRIPPLQQRRRRRRWSARSRPRRCCSATAAARWSTSPRSSDLMLRVAQLKNDLPQVRSLELPGARRRRRARPCSTRVGRVEPVADPRSDWFVRRLPHAARGHPPRLSAARLTAA